MGLSPGEADADIAAFEAAFPLLPESPDIYPAWKALVAAAGVTGKQVHDARLVAVCHVYGLAKLLTFGGQHFHGLGGIAPKVLVVHPQNV